MTNKRKNRRAKRAQNVTVNEERIKRRAFVQGINAFFLEYNKWFDSLLERSLQMKKRADDLLEHVEETKTKIEELKNWHKQE